MYVLLSFLSSNRRISFVVVWEWFPEYIAPTLTGVSIFCLARQNSAWVTRIFGGAAGNEGASLALCLAHPQIVIAGLGLFSFCFDWNYVGSGGSAYGALFQPIATQVSSYIGILICVYVCLYSLDSMTKLLQAGIYRGICKERLVLSELSVS